MQVDLRGKITSEIELRSCGDHFYKLWACNPDHLSKIVPSKIQGCNVEEGGFGKNGSVVVWNYVNDGKDNVTKVVTEDVDLERRTINHRVIEGDLLNYYKSFSNHLQVTPKGDNICLIKWTFEYEKLNEDVPDPTSLVDFMVGLTKDVEVLSKTRPSIDHGSI